MVHLICFHSRGISCQNNNRPVIWIPGNDRNFRSLPINRKFRYPTSGSGYFRLRILLPDVTRSYLWLFGSPIWFENFVCGVSSDTKLVLPHLFRPTSPKWNKRRLARGTKNLAKAPRWYIRCQTASPPKTSAYNFIRFLKSTSSFFSQALLPTGALSFKLV